jgi:outer membrane lipoprotein SlyB
MSRHLIGASLLLALFALAPVPAQARHDRCGNCGTVVDVDRISYGRDSSAEGTVLGAIIGGVVGNQVGSGSGRRAATVAGAVAGGLIGRRIDRDNDRGGGYVGRRLEIRMDRGGYRVIEVHGPMEVYRGDRVRVYRNRVELIY